MRITLTCLISLMSLVTYAQSTSPSFKKEVEQEDSVVKIKRISTAFAAAKGKLIYPTENGRILNRSSEYAHMHRVSTPNSGIEITTNGNGTVHSIFEGVVSAVFEVEGYKIVMIRHGMYFSVYTHLATVSVTKGQNVRLYDSIGTIAKNDMGEFTLGFQLWESDGNKKQTQLNPEVWLMH